MLLEIFLAVLLLGVCVLLIAVGSLMGRGSFKIGHACRMKTPARRKLRNTSKDY